MSPAVPRSAVDLRGALALCGTMLKYLSVSALFPGAVALWYSEPVWPFLGAGAIAAVVGLALERLGRSDEHPRVQGGLSRRVAHLAAGGVLRRVAVHLLG